MRCETYPGGYFSIFALNAFGQGLTSVSGSTQDPSGAVIPSVAVVLANVGTGVERNDVSDSQGRYSFSQVQPGSYRLTAKASGFNEVTVDVRLLVNTPATVDLNFEKPRRTAANSCASRPGHAKFSCSELPMAYDVNGVSRGDGHTEQPAQ